MDNPTISSLSTEHYQALTTVFASQLPKIPSPLTFTTSMPSSSSSSSTSTQQDILQALHDISSKIENFTNHTTLPENTNAADTQHVTWQIAHWSSIFLSMFNKHQIPQPPATATAQLTPNLTSLQQPSTVDPVPTSNISSATLPPPTPVLAASVVPVSTSNISSSTLPPPTPVLAASVVPNTDNETQEVYQKYGQTIPYNEWLDSLFIPRNAQTLADIKEIWELGEKNWTAKMRRQGSKNHSSIYNMRKTVYNAFKECNFDESKVMEIFQTVKPGKLYKTLIGRKKN